MPLTHISPPVTDSGAGLILTDEQEKTLKVLYSPSDKPDLYEFAGFYDPDIPDEDYQDNLIALPLRSTYGGIRLIPANTQVVNVIGSGGDLYVNPHGQVITASWIDAWERYCLYPNGRRCYVRQNGSPCGKGLYGGHLIYANDTQPSGGENNKVFILPICSVHNNWHNVGIMQVTDNINALVLNRYHLNN